MQVKACGLCGTDLKIVRAGSGHLAAGAAVHHRPRVVGRGRGARGRAGAPAVPWATGWWPRTTPAAAPARGAGPGRYNLCERVQRPGFKLYGHTAPGALAEYAVRPAVALHKVPPEITDVAAALVNQGALTVHAPAGPGSGRVAAWRSSALAARPAHAAGGAGRRGDHRRRGGPRAPPRPRPPLGATAALDYSRPDPVAGVREDTGGRGADCVFDCSGNPAVVGPAARPAAPRRDRRAARPGRRRDAPNCRWTPWSPSTSSTCSASVPARTPTPPMIALLASGAIRAEPLTSHVYPLANVATAFAALRSRAAIRPIVTL